MDFPRSLQVPDNGSQEGKIWLFKNKFGACGKRGCFPVRSKVTCMTTDTGKE